MGVVYKLREDVISFIITLKKNNPAISVRQLAQLTSDQFHIKVSKSSVSSVLKGAMLSSSVGRRSGSTERPEKFAIPSGKKEQLSKSMEEAGFPKEERPLPKEEDRPQPTGRPPGPIQKKKEEKPAVKPGPVEKQQVFPAKSPAEQAPAEKTPVKEELPPEKRPESRDFSAYVEKVRRERKALEKIVPKGLGFVFLKAALWDVSPRPLMAELLSKYIQAPGSGQFASVGDMFLFLKALGDGTADDISAYKEHGLWALNGFSGPGIDGKKALAELQELFQWEKTMADSPSFSTFIMEYSQVKEQSLLEVKGFKLLLEDRSELTMDASLVSFGGAGTMPAFPYRALPIHKAMDSLSDCLISNIHSAIFRCAPGEPRLDRSFYDMVSVFEDLPGKRILRAAVIDEQDGEIASFSTIPHQKRSFLVGIGPKQKEFAELTKAGKWPAKRPFYHEGTDRTVYFVETKTDLLKFKLGEGVGDFRVITVWNGKESSPCWAILTNRQAGDAEDVLKAYISQWPYLGESLEGGPGPAMPPGVQEDTIREEGEKKATNIFSDFAGALYAYCQKHFFPTAYAQTPLNLLFADIYDISGTFLETDDSLNVLLDVKEDPARRSNLEYAVKRVNERCILDYSGRRLWIKT